MKSLFRNTLVKPGAAIALAIACLLGGTAAQAAGTASNTTITNQATLAYTVGTTAQNPIPSSPTSAPADAGKTTDFLVDNKINLLVSTQDTTFVSVVPKQTTTTATALQVATFKVKNTGNTAQGFLLTTANLGNGTLLFTTGVDNIDSDGACTIKVDTAVGAVGGTVTAAGYSTGLASATSIASIAADVERIVYVVCPIASTAVDGDTAVISLTAQAATTGSSPVALVETTGVNTSGVDIVFADIAGTDDIARDAKSSSRDAFKVRSAKLTVTKTVTPVCDPFNGNANNGAKNIPGSYVRYRISIANATGAASATLDNVTDTLVSTLAFDSDLILIDQTLTASTANSASTAAACKSVATGGTATSATGNVNIVQTNRSINGFLIGSPVGSLLTVNLATALPVQSGYLAGELKAGESVSVTFQALIN